MSSEVEERNYWGFSDFRLKRTWIQGIYFYLVWVFAAFVLGFLFGGGILGAFDFFPPDDFSEKLIARIPLLFLALGLGISILEEKKRMNKILDWVILSASIALACFFGATFGLIPIAYLSTQPTT